MTAPGVLLVLARERSRSGPTRDATRGSPWFHKPRAARRSETMGTMDISQLAELLRETAEHHDPFEQVATKHDWWDWYAAYIDAREHGSQPDEASQAAARYMEEVKRVSPRT